MSTKIEWTEETWNPVVGCNKTSTGCKNCYAEVMAKRLVGMGQEKYFPVVGPHGWTGRTNFAESELEKPLQWKKPRTIFVSSMGDLFHESVPDQWLYRVFQVMEEANHHTFLLLTKRPYMAKSFFMRHVNNDNLKLVQHIWLGATAENQEQADKRIPILLSTPAAKRFVSIEPMLSSVDIRNYLPVIVGHGQYHHENGDINWVICGSESGNGRRECDEDWVRSLRDQCQEAEVPFFLKQLHRNGKKVAMPELDSKEWRERP